MKGIASVVTLIVAITGVSCASGDSRIATPAADACSPTALIRNPTIFDVDRGMMRKVGAITIERGIVTGIADLEEAVDATSDGLTIEAEGMYVVPGLWDMHVHLFRAREESLPLMLAYGITSVRDMGGDVEELLSWRLRLASGALAGPRLFIAGPMLESPSWMEKARERGASEASLATHMPVATADEARMVVQKLADAGVDFIKVRSWTSEEVMLALGKAARERGLRMAGHPDWSLDPIQALEAGLTDFEHGFYPWPAAGGETRQRLVEAMIEHDGALVPTLVAWEPRAIPYERAQAITDDELGLLDARRRYLAPELIESWNNSLRNRKDEDREGIEGWRRVLDQHASDIGRFHDEGVTVLPGTDLAGALIYPGSGLHEELELLVEKAGFTPAEAITAATRDAARFMGRSDLGGIGKGKVADLVLLRRDPTEDIRYLRTIEGVLKEGCHRDVNQLSAMIEDLAKSGEAGSRLQF